MPTFIERQDLAKQFADNVVRMRRCLHTAGKQVDDDDIVVAWAAYSDGLCAGWRILPENEDELLAILLKHLPPSGQRVTIQDAGDGSGDGMLELPDDLIVQLGWKEGDTLSITNDESGALILHRAE